VIDAIDVHVRLVPAARIGSAYRLATGATDATGAARAGPPACAQGVSDERAWSISAAPGNAIGRYRCRFERGRAAMWWTHGDRLVHAVARDSDLAGLFSWWRTHPAQ
jgi:hypothetical protein